MQYRESHIIIDSPFDRDQFGMVTARAKIARIGIQTYRVDGKVIRELRSVDEVVKSVNTFTNKPVTLNHPFSKVVTSKNASTEVKGFVTDLGYEEGWMTATIHITHDEAITAAQTTHNKFSNGYMADLEFFDEPRIWIDELGVMGDVGAKYEYDAAQKNIEGNHVALVMNPRAGSDATFIDNSIDDIITIDTEDQINNEPNINIMPETTETKTIVMHSLTIGDSTFEISEDNSKEIIAAVNALNGKVDGLETSLAEANATINTLESTRTDSDAIASEVQERTETWALVAPHIDSDVDYNLSAVDIKKLYLKSVAPNLAAKIDSADDSYIEGLWDIKQPEIKDDAAEINDELLEQQTSPTTKTEAVADEDDLKDLRDKFNASRQNYFS